MSRRTSSGSGNVDPVSRTHRKAWRQTGTVDSWPSCHSRRWHSIWRGMAGSLLFVTRRAERERRLRKALEARDAVMGREPAGGSELTASLRGSTDLHPLRDVPACSQADVPETCPSGRRERGALSGPARGGTSTCVQALATSGV